MADTVVTVNGQHRTLEGVPVHTTALDWLRAIGLTGAKEGCAEGECGACAMLLVAADDAGGGDGSGEGTSAWVPVNACLVPVYALDGQEIVTAEGLGAPDALHPVQERLAEAGGSQCGYCTPGFVCSMAAEFYRTDREPQEAEHPAAEHGPNGFDLHALSGNLCRCTGYRPIRDAAYALGMPQPGDPLAARRARPAPPPVPTEQEVGGARFVRPATLDVALRLMRDEPDATVVAGATDWGVEVNLRGRRAGLVVAIDRLVELRSLTVTEDAVEIGAALPLSEIERGLGRPVPRIPLLGELLPQFASRLIRNRATLGGNLGTASPIGDASPVLLALGARVVLTSLDGAGTGEREIELADYFTGYRETIRRPDELIRAIRIPLPVAPVAAFHKIAKRRFDDISSAAIGVALDIQDGVVTAARIGLGGVAATPIRAYATEERLVGEPWTFATVSAAAIVLGAEGTPMSDHRASAQYRAQMLSQSLLKLYSVAAEAAGAAQPGEATA